MPSFTHTRLEEGEVLVIGPVVFSSASSLRVGAGGAQSAQVRRRDERRIGVTNRRVIVEQGGKTHIILNTDIRRVYVRRERGGVKIEKIETKRGQTVTLNMAGLGPRDQARLFEVLAEAEIGEKKGLFGRFSRIAPRPAAAPRRPSSPKPPVRDDVSAAASPASSAKGWSDSGKSSMDDADIETLGDLRRYYPLPKEYDYEQTAEGEYLVRRLSDGARFPFLLEEEMLSFDVPVQDAGRKKVTVEIEKHA